MDQNNKKQVGAISHSHSNGSSSSSSSSTSSSSSSTNLDHLFGPKNSSSSASSSLFGSIFPPPSSAGPGRERNSGNTTRGSSKSSVYQNINGSVDQPCNFNSSILYGGQENYNVPKSGSTYESSQHHQHNFKKDGGHEDDSNGSDSTSRGNWWKGSLYY